MSRIEHLKRILLIEDQEQFYKPVMRWLSDEGYYVTHVGTYDEALHAIHHEHFHLALVDLSLVYDDPDNEDGFRLLQEIQDIGLRDYMPCIMLTAFGTMPKTLKAFNILHVSRFIPKEAGFRRELLTAVDEIFNQEIQINFDLQYADDSAHIIDQIAQGINWTVGKRPAHDGLTAQVLDLFGHLFFEAKSVEINPLTPGLTGASVIRVRPTWAQGRGTSSVAKIGRADKVRTEAERFEENVLNFLPPNTISQVKKVTYTRHIGALLFTFTEHDMVPLKEFDAFYHAQQSDIIMDSLRNLFETTCRHWYNGTREPLSEQDLQSVYYATFQYDVSKLVQRIQIVLPEFDPDTPTFRFCEEGVEWTNPIYWLSRHAESCTMPIYRSITHGDLNGRNIMVDHTNKCWLIDFYRTQKSHIMRDFVILESDIKYRLMPKLSQESFYRLEKLLLNGSDMSAEEETDIAKAVRVVKTLRELAHQFASGDQGMIDEAEQKKLEQEHLTSMLMTTLNVVRLRHIDETRKFQALLSASLLCTKLDMLAGRPIERPWPSEPARLTLPRLYFSAQLHHLSELLSQDRLSLYIGSEKTAVFTKPHFHAWQKNLPWRTIFTHPGTANGSGIERNAYQFIDQIGTLLHNGEAILLLGASDAELKVVRDASHGLNIDGQLWVVGGHLLDEQQDAYRNLGYRVLLETPDRMIEAFQ